MCIAEQERACRQRQWEKSALVEHLLTNYNNVVKFKEMKILSSTLDCPTRLYWQVIKLYNHNNSLNMKEESLRLSKPWYPALRCSRIASMDITSNSIFDTGEQRDWPSSRPVSYTHLDVYKRQVQKHA